MITVEIRKFGEEYAGFSSKGHAGYAEEGYDILVSYTQTTGRYIDMEQEEQSWQEN